MLSQQLLSETESRYITSIVCLYELYEHVARWVEVKYGTEIWLFVGAHGLGSERDDGERENYWSDMNACIQNFGYNVSIILLGDLNARVEDAVIEVGVGRVGVPRVHQSGERMIGLCGVRQQIIGNTFFARMELAKYTWM